MEKPKPATDWPDIPLTEDEAADRLNDGLAVWVMDADEAVRPATVPTGGPETPIVDIVIETDEAFDMYSYTGGQWMDYGTQRKDDEDAPPMDGTLASYRILIGETELDLE